MTAMPRLVHPQQQAKKAKSRRGLYGLAIRSVIYAIICLVLVLVILRTVQDL